MRMLSCLSTIVLASYLGAEDDAITIRPIQIMSQAKVPDGVPNDAKRIGFTEGFAIGYLVEGTDIIGIKDHSLKIEHMLLPDGSDVSKKRNGDDNWEQGPFPAISDDGAFGYFQVQSKHPLFGKVESLSIKGTVVVRTGTGITVAKSKEHDVKTAGADTADDFSITFTPAGKSDDGDNDGKQNCGLQLSGPMAKLSQIRLLAGDAEISPNSWTNTETGPRNYNFPIEKSVTKVVVQIRYWKNLKEVPVSFGK